MALLFVDGFDHYATADIGKKYTDYYASNLEIQSTTRRTGTAALRAYGGSSYVRKGFQLTTGAVIIGAAFLLRPGTITAPLVRFRNAAGDQCTLRMYDDGSIAILRASTVLQTSSGGIIYRDTWQYLEAKVVCADAGSWEVRINGVTVLNGTGDTQNQSTAGCSAIDLNGCLGSNYTFFDDFYIADTTGSYCNDFLGDSQVDTLYPDEDGAVLQWTPSAGSTHYSLVDEASSIDTSDYVEATAFNLVDVYGHTDLSALNTDLVHAVVVTDASAKTESGEAGIEGVLRISSTNYSTGRVSLSMTHTVNQHIWMRNPATSGAWSRDAINSAQIGVRSVA